MLILFFLVRFGVGLQGNVLLYLAVLIGTVMASTAMGLVLSSVVRSAEAAMAVVPIILIPQIMLAGVLKPLDTKPLKALAAPMISRWSNEALVGIEHKALKDKKREMTVKVFVGTCKSPPSPAKRRPSGRSVPGRMMQCPEFEHLVKCEEDTKKREPWPIWKKQVIEKNKLAANKQKRDLFYLLMFALGFGVLCAGFMLRKDRKA